MQPVLWAWLLGAPVILALVDLMRTPKPRFDAGRDTAFVGDTYVRRDEPVVL